MSGSTLIEARGLPPHPLDAAAAFHQSYVPALRALAGDAKDAIVVFDPADYTHDGWRLAAIQELAREAAPARVNGVVAPVEAANALAQTAQFCHASPGITGQIFTVDGNSPEND